MNLAKSGAADASGLLVLSFGPFPRDWVVTEVFVNAEVVGLFVADLALDGELVWNGFRVSSAALPNQFAASVWHRLRQPGFAVVSLSNLGPGGLGGACLSVRAAYDKGAVPT